MKPATIPITTYRLQFNSQFTFQHAKEIVDYLCDLGITHFYCSPLLKAKQGSLHGYDITDHSTFNPEVGTKEQFEMLVNTLRDHQMGLICDIVPNHMSVMDSSNKWWVNVLENGPASPYADYFDIDWHPPQKKLQNKLLLPLLEQQYGTALEKQTLKVIYQNGAFFLELPHHNLPTDPKSWNLILEPLIKRMKPLEFQELKSIATSIHHLPDTTETNPERVEERHREKEIIKRRLDTLMKENELLQRELLQELEGFNGNSFDPSSFSRLENFLNAQSYLLSFWRVASDEINFRRFFDICEYAGIKTEKREVFEAIHALLFECIENGWIDGIRIDHIDGLWDPEQYLKDLTEKCKLKGKRTTPLYCILEKILIGNEKLEPEWPIDGTVGYDILNLLNGVFVSQVNIKAIHEIYRNFTNITANPSELAYRCKKLIMIVSLSSELHMLARSLVHIAEQHRNSRDFTAESLRGALRDIIACFPVYRTYIRASQEKIHEEDRHHMMTAISKAKRLNPAINESIFDFLKSLLLLEYPDDLNTEQKEEWQNFIMRFQQLTGPVMAKGIEDTAFYRFYPLASLNEVGNDLYSLGNSVELFHTKIQDRFKTHPHSMSTISTHDTKRSDDVRARINVLSEIPEEWEQALGRWSKFNRIYKEETMKESEIPDSNEEYLIYQTLIGTWPFSPMDKKTHLEYVERIQMYMEKAIKEAKIHSSWVNPSKFYDQQIQQFIEKILDQNSNPFLNDFKAFIPKISMAGIFNSLSQTLLHLSLPGVPDIYQGSEIWNFTLVDPDNRRPVDFQKRKTILDELNEQKNNPSDLLLKLMQNPEDGRIKLYLIRTLLKLRQRLPNLFLDGSYIPLQVIGEKENHLIAFARFADQKAVIVIAPRLFIPLMQNNTHIQPEIWKDTAIILPKELTSFKFRNIFTDMIFESDKEGEQIVLKVSKNLSPIPQILLESVSS